MRIYHIDVVNDSKLGFGRRVVIWVSGCPFRCEGCIADEFLELESGRDYSIDKVLEIINSFGDIDGVTLSGGEPFFQIDELKELFLRLGKIDKMVFTGYNLDELNKTQLEVFNISDLVVTGRFEKDKMGNFLWRGSSNQKIYSPTRKYDVSIFENAPSKGIEVVVEHNEMFFYGIPTGNELEVIEDRLKEFKIKVF